MLTLLCFTFHKINSQECEKNEGYLKVFFKITRQVLTLARKTYGFCFGFFLNICIGV